MTKTNEPIDVVKSALILYLRIAPNERLIEEIIKFAQETIEYKDDPENFSHLKLSKCKNELLNRLRSK